MMRMIFALVSLVTFIATASSVEKNQVWYLACNSSETITRAIGANFSVTIISPCRIDALQCRITYIFMEDGRPGNYVAKKITVDSGGSNGAMIQTYQEGGVTISYSYSKAVDRNEVIFNLHMVPENRPVIMLMMVNSHMPCKNLFYQFAKVNFTGCRNHADFITLRQPMDIARYMAVGDIVCNKYGKGRAIFVNGSEALQTYCDADATWKDFGNITCLYPISAKVMIAGGRYNETITLYYNHSTEDQEVAVLLYCITDNTTRMFGSPKFMLENEHIQNLSLLVNPSLNGKMVSCYFENNFTKYFGTNMTYLYTSVLTIKFGPYPPPGHSVLCSLHNGSIPFYSNPLSAENSLSLIVKGAQYEEIKAKIETCCPPNYGVTGQMITPVMKYVENSNFTLYLRSNISGDYVDYKVVPCDDVVLTTAVTTTYGVTMTYGAGTGTEPISGFPKSLMTILILSAVAGFLLMVLIGCLLWNRHLQGFEKMQNNAR